MQRYRRQHVFRWRKFCCECTEFRIELCSIVILRCVELSSHLTALLSLAAEGKYILYEQAILFNWYIVSGADGIFLALL